MRHLPPDYLGRELGPQTTAILRFFAYDHLPEGPLRDTSRSVASAAYWLASYLPEGPELTTGLRKLLEAKDCFVRCALDLPDDYLADDDQE